ncbi:hypothetical protein [Xenophilus azovorans]|nr:hypothetical protein [Xenophilus azovorans]
MGDAVGAAQARSAIRNAIGPLLVFYFDFSNAEARIRYAKAEAVMEA